MSSFNKVVGSDRPCRQRIPPSAARGLAARAARVHPEGRFVTRNGASGPPLDRQSSAR